MFRAEGEKSAHAGIAGSDGLPDDALTLSEVVADDAEMLPQAAVSHTILHRLVKKIAAPALQEGRYRLLGKASYCDLSGSTRFWEGFSWKLATKYDLAQIRSVVIGVTGVRG